MKHEQLSELLDQLETSEYGTKEYRRADHQVSAYFMHHMMNDDNTIPNGMILRLYKISLKKIGLIRTIKGIFSGIRSFF